MLRGAVVLWRRDIGRQDVRIMGTGRFGHLG